MSGVEIGALDDGGAHTHFAEHLRQRNDHQRGRKNTEIVNAERSRKNRENDDLDQAPANGAAEGEVEPFNREFRERFCHQPSCDGRPPEPQAILGCACVRFNLEVSGSPALP
jgi:hypothetical protein